MIPRFITPRKSKELIRKLSAFAGPRQTELLHRELYVDSRLKSDNESIYLTIDRIQAVIADKLLTTLYGCNINEYTHPLIPEMLHGRRTMSTLPIPERRMIDIHMHLIPGVDDGAENMEMALAMMIRAKQQGIIQIIATPHSEAFRYAKEGGKIIFRRLLDAAEKVYPDMKIYLGCEVYCEARSMDKVLEDLESGRYPTMNGTNYVLMEFSTWVEPEGALHCVDALVNAGYRPIIAHMERYRYLRDNMNLVDRFRELGSLIQLNAYSLLDEMDDSIKNWARRLVQERKVDFLGTDAHRTYHRPPSAEHGLNWLYENVEREYVEAIAWGNAQQLLNTTL